MPRAVWIILGVAGALVALLLIGVAVVVATVDPNRFVAPLAERVKAATGRNLTVHGPVDFKVSLEPKIVLDEVTFDNAPWSKTGQMLVAKRIEAQIALLPLLSRRFEIVQFKLVEPVIALETDASGRGNWEFGPSATNAPNAPSAAASATQAFGVANFEIEHGTLTFRNGTTGKVTNASIERMTLHARDMQAPVAVDFRGKVDDVPVALSGDLGPPDKWLRQQWPYPVALKGEIDGNSAKVTTKIAKAGTTTTLDDLALGYGPLAATGRVRVISQGATTRYAVDLDVPSLSLGDLPGKRGLQQGAVGGDSKPATRWLISDAPLPLAPLAELDSEGSIAVGELRLRDGERLQRIVMQFTTHGGGVDARFTVASILGGSLRGSLAIDARRSDAPTMHLKFDSQDLDLPALAAAAGIKRDIKGGKVRASVDVGGRGATLHRVASTMSGTILFVSGPASLGRSAIQGESAIAVLAGALDPLRSVDAATELRCAVFRLPLADGVAHVDQSIAIETGRLAASASGTLDFRDETLDLSVRPQIREGAKIDASQFASLVRVRGRFDRPAVAIDAAQSAVTIAKLGALGAAGGGLAVLGGALLGSTGGSSDLCAVAMGGRSAQKPEPARKGSEPSADPTKDVGKALGKLLGR